MDGGSGERRRLALLGVAAGRVPALGDPLGGVGQREETRSGWFATLLADCAAGRRLERYTLKPKST